MKSNLIVFVTIFLLFSLSVGSTLFPLQESNPIDNPLEEDTYTFKYYESLIFRTMTGYIELEEDQLGQYQTYYKIYYSKDIYAVILMIERYEKYDQGTHSLIQRFILDDLGNIIKEETFSFEGVLKNYVVYEYDPEGRLLRQAKYDDNDELKSEKLITYNNDGTYLRIEYYNRGRIVKKEIYGDRNELKKVYVYYYYYSTGNLEKKEEYDENNTIQKVTIFDENGKAKLKIFYEDGEQVNIVDMQPEDDGEEMDLNIEEDLADGYGYGIGPNVVVVNDMFKFVDGYVGNSAELETITIEGKTFENTSDNFIFILLYSQGIDLYTEMKELDDENRRGKIYYLWQYLTSQGVTYEKQYRNIIQKGDLIFIDGVYDVNGDGNSDKKTHIAIVEEGPDRYGEIKIIHSQGYGFGGIERGSINLTMGDSDTIIKAQGSNVKAINVISGIAKPDYLDIMLKE